MKTVILTAAAGEVVFGRGEFVLSSFSLTPARTDGVTEARTAILTGAIVPEGNTEAERAVRMAALRARLTRIASDPDGFTLIEDGRSLCLVCDHAPDFSREAPFSGTDAAAFTIRAKTTGNGFFTGTPTTLSGAGQAGTLIFPLAITSSTVFGISHPTGELIVENPGDAPCGFLAAITAQGGSLTSFQLYRGTAGTTDRIQTTHTVSDGGELLIDTRPGHKGVTADGVSVMPDVNWQSVFFPLLPGENRIGWQSEGLGAPRVSLTFTPVYG